MKKLFNSKRHIGVRGLSLCYLVALSSGVAAEQSFELGQDAANQPHNTALSLIKRQTINGISCVQCHGLTGKPEVSDTSRKQVPNLAGQDMSYLYDQLINFKLGYRVTSEMKGLLTQYSDSELQLIAHYYASQNNSLDREVDIRLDPLKHSKEEDDNWAKLGASLYLKGDEARGIQACQNCHGIYGQGRIIGLDKAPKLTGQHARYVRMTLENYGKGSRTTDTLFDNPMQMISRKLNENDRRHLGAYIQKLKPPKTDAY